MIGAALPISPLTHIEILGVLLAMLAGSSIIFFLLARRMTLWKDHVAMIEWGKEAGFKPVAADAAQLTGVLEAIVKREEEVEVFLEGQRSRLLRCHGDDQLWWNVLVRRVERSWQTAGLRPVIASHSALDKFSLSSFPDASGKERFLLFAKDSDSADVFPAAVAQSLLPPDIGLLLSGNELLLDFSARPFDDLEFDRMIALAEQLALKLEPKHRFAGGPGSGAVYLP